MDRICDTCKHFDREDPSFGAGACTVKLPPWLYRTQVRIGNETYEEAADTSVFWNETCTLWEAKHVDR